MGNCRIANNLADEQLKISQIREASYKMFAG